MMPGIPYPNLNPSPHKPGGANQVAAHRGRLMGEDMFDVSSNTRGYSSAPVRLDICYREFLYHSLLMDSR